jgi:hypothetical protein
VVSAPALAIALELLLAPLGCALELLTLAPGRRLHVPNRMSRWVALAELPHDRAQLLMPAPIFLFALALERRLILIAVLPSRPRSGLGASVSER